MKRIPLVLVAIVFWVAVWFGSHHARPILNRIQHPGYGWCLKCQRTWDVVKGHSTVLREAADGTNGMSCFPLCQQCWIDLKTPEARLPFYRKLVDNWKRDDTAPENSERYWPLMKASVLAGN